jgi:hypothetical protein
MTVKPLDPDDPLIQQNRESIIRAATAHAAAAVAFPALDSRAASLRDGMISATWVGEVLVVVADRTCATDLELLLRGALLADPERAA